MNKNVELDFLKDQIANQGDEKISRILWTAYAYHFSLEVDTLEYDHTLNDLYLWCRKWGYIPKAGTNLETFYNFMSEFLV